MALVGKAECECILRNTVIVLLQALFGFLGPNLYCSAGYARNTARGGPSHYDWSSQV